MTQAGLEALIAEGQEAVDLWVNHATLGFTYEDRSGVAGLIRRLTEALTALANKEAPNE